MGPFDNDDDDDDDDGDEVDETSELERLAIDQLNDMDSDEDDRRVRSRQRRERIMELFQSQRIESAEDHYFAALVLLYGEEVAHFELSKTFARRATELGESRAWSVIAAAWDRSLLARHLPQRFGTQFIREQGRLSLGKVDPNVTDAQRALYGVPPLWVQQQTVERLRRREDAP